MKNKDLYLKNVKSIFPIRSKKEKEYLKIFEKNVNEYDEDYPSSSYDEFEDKFGKPKEIFINYIENVDDVYLIKKLNTRKVIKILCIIILVFVALIEVWRGYLLYQGYKAASEERITEVEYTQPEEIPLSKENK